MTIDEKVALLREELKSNPSKREIIIRQVRALELASGKKYLKTAAK